MFSLFIFFGTKYVFTFNACISSLLLAHSFSLPLSHVFFLSYFWWFSKWICLFFLCVCVLNYVSSTFPAFFWPLMNDYKGAISCLLSEILSPTTVYIKKAWHEGGHTSLHATAIVIMYSLSSWFEQSRSVQGHIHSTTIQVYAP